MFWLRIQNRYKYIDMSEIVYCTNMAWQYGQRIENISTIFINMHHILNEYRPHQARETLRLLMENQLEKKKEKTAEIRR